MEKNLCGNDPKSFLFDSFYIGVMITYYKYKIQKSHVLLTILNNYLKIKIKSYWIYQTFFFVLKTVFKKLGFKNIVYVGKLRLLILCF